MLTSLSPTIFYSVYKITAAIHCFFINPVTRKSSKWDLCKAGGLLVARPGQVQQGGHQQLAGRVFAHFRRGGGGAEEAAPLWDEETSSPSGLPRYVGWPCAPANCLLWSADGNQPPHRPPPLQTAGTSSCDVTCIRGVASWRLKIMACRLRLLRSSSPLSARSLRYRHNCSRVFKVILIHSASRTKINKEKSLLQLFLAD